MCRVAYTFFTCGHTNIRSEDCEIAQSYGPYFNRTGCVNYVFSSTHAQAQCGKLMGFYCALTENGVIIDKCRDILSRLEPLRNDKNAEKQRICTSWDTYRSQTLARGQSLDQLASISTYRNIDQQRQQLIQECAALEYRCQYLKGLIGHAHRNRDLLTPTFHQKIWEGTSFDFDASIFPPHMLEPIRRQIPAPFPMPAASAATNTANVMNQHQHPQQAMGFPPNANPSMSAPPLQQTRSTQQQMVPSTPKAQVGAIAKSSPIGEDIIRGHTPEGETREEKAVRYREQLKVAADRKMADSMAKQGYDVAKYGVSPAPKVGARRPSRPKPIPLSNEGSPVATPKKATPKKDKPTAMPTKVRRSARTKNTKPKYTDSPGEADFDFSPNFNAMDKSDAAWNGSPGRSEESWSPERQVKGGRGQNRRATLDSITSSVSSPTRGQESLGNRILEYQRSTESSGRPASTQNHGAISLQGMPFQFGSQPPSNQTPQIDSPQLHYQSVNSKASSTYGGPAEGQPAISQDAFQRATATQRSMYLAQELGRSLYQQQLATGIVGTSAVRASSSPQNPQEAASPSMPYASHATQTRAPSTSLLQSAPNQYGGLPMAPANIFHQNYRQSMGPNRSFSTGSMPTSGVFSQLGRDGPMPTLNSNFQPQAPTQPDYESMRRSFSSTANLTPQATITDDHAATISSPTKRSVPPASPTAVRKRVRLSLPGQSLPGEDEAPTLRPSTSSSQLHTPAGMPADDTVDYSASIKAIEAFEKDNASNLAGLPTSLSTSDPQHPVPSYEATQAPAGVHETTKGTTDSNSQLPVSHYSTPSYGTYQTLGNTQVSPDNKIDKSSHLSEPSESNQHDQTIGNETHADEAKDTVSEPDWSLLADDVFHMP